MSGDREAIPPSNPQDGPPRVILRGHDSYRPRILDLADREPAITQAQLNLPELRKLRRSVGKGIRGAPYIPNVPGGVKRVLRKSIFLGFIVHVEPLRERESRAWGHSVVIPAARGLGP